MRLIGLILLAVMLFSCNTSGTDAKKDENAVKAPAVLKYEMEEALFKGDRNKLARAVLFLKKKGCAEKIEFRKDYTLDQFRTQAQPFIAWYMAKTDAEKAKIDKGWYKYWAHNTVMFQ